jgi:hypothetical protein
VLIADESITLSATPSPASSRAVREGVPGIVDGQGGVERDPISGSSATPRLRAAQAHLFLHAKHSVNVVRGFFNGF